MISEEVRVSTARELADAIDGWADVVHIRQDIHDMPSFALPPGRRLTGDGATITFRSGGDGLELTRDNQVSGLRLRVDPDRRAIFNDTQEVDLGHVVLAQLKVIGQVQIVAENATTTGLVTIAGLDIEAADCRDREHVWGYGVVDVKQGALTVWNRQRSDGSELTVDIAGVRIGREKAPVAGAGVVICGSGDPSGRMNPQPQPEGRVRIQRLETEEIFVDGGIPAGTANLIGGGVMVLYGVQADAIRQHAKVTTYGSNDMVIDNWGDVQRWRCADLTSYGASAVGVVNFGVIEDLTVEGPITTFGTGARGLNVYLGRIGSADIHQIDTHGDAAVGIQLTRPVRQLTVRHGIRTRGGVGPGLVRGEIVQLPAVALSLLEGAEVAYLRLLGPLHADEGSAVQIQGRVAVLKIQ